jgi:tRNA (guanosine-2'-O-)-methyltransferase
MKVLIAVLVAACGGPAEPAKVAEGPTATKIEAPPGVQLAQACTPSGPEICFNATDDNCNGVLDEGCGLQTGPLQFMIAWGDNPSDVDLLVTDPGGARVSEGNRATSSGLRLDRDCPSEACHGQNVENVVFEGSEPPRGRYKVDVVLTELHEATAPVSVRFGARIGSRSYSADLPMGKGERKTFTFDL